MDTSTFFNKSQCSVEVSKNSKGYTWSIKVYADKIDECIEETKKADEKMKALYPSV